MNELLGTVVEVIIDRPLGSKHPATDLIYPINYGYIPGIIAGDNKELDAYILGENKALQTFTGIVIAIVHRLDDVEDKVVVAKQLNQYTKSEIQQQIHFQEQYFTSILRMTPDN